MNPSVLLSFLKRYFKHGLVYELSHLWLGLYIFLFLPVKNTIGILIFTKIVAPFSFQTCIATCQSPSLFSGSYSRARGYWKAKLSMAFVPGKSLCGRIDVVPEIGIWFLEFSWPAVITQCSFCHILSYSSHSTRKRICCCPGLGSLPA